MGRHHRTPSRRMPPLDAVTGDRRVLAAVVAVAVAVVAFGGVQLFGSEEPPASDVALGSATVDRRAVTVPSTRASDAPSPGTPANAGESGGDCGLEVARAAERAVDASVAAMALWRSHIVAQDALDARTITLDAAEAEWTRTRVAAPPTIQAYTDASKTFDAVAAQCSQPIPADCAERLDAARATLAIADPSLRQWQVHLDDIAQSAEMGHSRMMPWKQVWAEAKPGLQAWDDNVPVWTGTTSCV